MRWTIQAQTSSAPGAMYVRWQINATPVYAVLMTDAGTYRPLIEGDRAALPVQWLLRASRYLMPGAMYMRWQINATPVYAVPMMDAGTLYQDLIGVPWLMLAPAQVFKLMTLGVGM